MKILPPVKSIPKSGYQKGTSTKRKDYDDILQQARELEVGESLPVECESDREVDRIRTGLINRLQDGNHSEMSVWIRGSVVYVTRNI